MTQAIGSAAYSITVYAAQPPAWSEQVFTFLSQQGCQLNWQSAPPADDTTEPVHADAVILLSTEDCRQLTRTSHTSDSRPLHVLIAERPPSDAHINGIDAILPPQPDVVYQELCAHLRYHAENADLRQQLQQLQQHNADLRARLDEHEQLKHHLEILKNAIVRNVSHELKTPLLQVKASVALLAEDAQSQDLVSLATNATARLEAIVTNITLLGSSLDVQLGPVIIPDTIEYARRNLTRTWVNRDAVNRLIVERDDHLPPALADKQGLATVLQLLIDNALKFSQDDVIVSVHCHGDEIEIAVTDSGIGIEPDHISIIFDTFYQVDGSSTRRYGGSGVGLAIVRLILDHHNTQISVTSTVVEGSRFSFRLPVVHL